MQPSVYPSSLTRWRMRLGNAGVEELLAETIEAAKRAGVIKAARVKRVIVGTTVMEKNKNANDRFTLQSSGGIGRQRTV
jgi:IS5 family transposase